MVITPYCWYYSSIDVVGSVLWQTANYARVRYWLHLACLLLLASSTILALLAPSTRRLIFMFSIFHPPFYPSSTFRPKEVFPDSRNSITVRYNLHHIFHIPLGRNCSHSTFVLLVFAMMIGRDAIYIYISRT